MTSHAAVKPAGRGAIMVIAAALLVAVLAVWMVDHSGQKGSGLPDEFDYQIDQYRQVDPALIAYRQAVPSLPS